MKTSKEWLNHIEIAEQPKRGIDGRSWDDVLPGDNRHTKKRK